MNDQLLDDYKEGERVSVYMRSRGSGYGSKNGWIIEVVHGTIVEVYPYKHRCLVKLDTYFYRLYHMVDFSRLESHEKHHLTEHKG